eukprot:2029026-Rhodomonas_salina.3
MRAPAFLVLSERFSVFDFEKSKAQGTSSDIQVQRSVDQISAPYILVASYHRVSTRAARLLRVHSASSVSEGTRTSWRRLNIIAPSQYHAGYGATQAGTVFGPDLGCKSRFKSLPQRHSVQYCRVSSW